MDASPAQHHGGRIRAGPSWAFMALAASVPGLPAGAQVLVDGGRDPNNMAMYVWTVTNHTPNPIVAFQIPHHYGWTFEPPPGWKSDVTEQALPGTKAGQRVILFNAESPKSAIRPGQLAVFKDLITLDRATPTPATVVVGFADGATASVANVEIPWRAPWFQRFAQLIGFGAMFAAFLVIQALRALRKRRRAANESVVPSE
ncbi:MAG: hypothetical protein V2A79_12260 [Planctomycetota bacterium]